jgi:hypothetical protein
MRFSLAALGAVTVAAVIAPTASAQAPPSCASAVPAAVEFAGLPSRVLIGKDEPFGFRRTHASSLQPQPPFSATMVNHGDHLFFSRDLEHLSDDLSISFGFNDPAARVSLRYVEVDPASGARCGRKISKRVRPRRRVYISCANHAGTRYHRRYRPGRCLHFGPNGSFAGGMNLKQIHWRSWNRRLARGSAIECGFHLPCAGIPVSIRAYRPRTRCQRVVYTRLRATSSFGTTRVRLTGCSGPTS